ncbi:wall-associated receptor kinase-like 1 [Syzygium oleosum]|uniref:wall-associated receptor kinase-like 1 n=1 Tax=Syzygium oleosum TaxID=219896 RepID=UPI0024BB35C9|nr:wall-associated receptor kinase-like 1 [Syzygium oleosum]
MNREKMILATSSFVLVLVFAANRSADAAEPPPYSLACPGCLDTCGNFTNIPYPGGIGPICFLDPLYEINCQQTHGISALVLKNFSVVMLDIQLLQSLDSLGLIKAENYVVAECSDIQALMVISDTPQQVIGCRFSCGRNGTLGFYQ